MAIRTPWGTADHTEELAPGILSTSTPSHGGYRLTAVRQMQLESRLPAGVGAQAGEESGGHTWYEEDCDWSLVALAFPQHFPKDAEIRAAVRTVECSDRMFTGKHGCRQGIWAPMAAWLKSDEPQAKAIRERVARFEAAHADHWQSGSLGSVPHSAGVYPSGCWWVSFTRVCDQKRREEIVTEYPIKGFYTDAELAAIIARPLELKRSSILPKLPAFDPADCGGVFDGVGAVTSDADPGL